MPRCQSDHEHLAAFDRTCSPAPYATAGSRHSSRIFANSAASHNPLAYRCLTAGQALAKPKKKPFRRLPAHPNLGDAPDPPALGAEADEGIAMQKGLAGIRVLDFSDQSEGRAEGRILAIHTADRLSPSELRDLEAEGVTGTRPEGL